MEQPSGGRGPFGRAGFVPSEEAGELLERLLVAGIATVLVVRLYLVATGYPQVGGHGLHLAHLLWGGLLMLVSIVLMLSFLGKRVGRAASITGGIGFGLFIDEVGKFVTSDVDYFFRPAIAIIYVVFVLMFLSFRAIGRRPIVSVEAATANAVELLREAAVGRLDAAGKARALALLRGRDQGEALTAAIVAALSAAPVAAPRGQGRLARLAELGREVYGRLVGWRWYQRGLVWFFLGRALLTFVGLVSLIAGDAGFSPRHPGVSFAEGGNAVATLLSALLVVIGVTRLRVSRLAAYLWFKRGILVSIFLVQVFAFYREELVGVAWLAVDLAIWGALSYMIDLEERNGGEAPVLVGDESAGQVAFAL